MTYQIIYSSESATPMQTDDLEELLNQARRNNAESGITGALVYVDGIFLQILEGEMGTVQDLMARIAHDVRHETVTVLRESDIPAARFPGWEMAYVSATAEQIAKWAGIEGIVDMPHVVASLHQDARKAAQVTQSILAALTPVATSSSKVN